MPVKKQRLQSNRSFYKLSQNFIDPYFTDWNKLKGNNIAVRYDSVTTVLEYRDIKDFDLFKALHIKKVCNIPPSGVSFTTLEGTGSLFPHRDHDAKVALNFYIHAGLDATKFYSLKDLDADPIFHYPGKEDAKIYDYSSLIEEGCFIASSNDVYLLNVSNIHSVEKVSKVPRVFISYSWNNNSYEEVLKNIKELENDLVLPE